MPQTPSKATVAAPSTPKTGDKQRQGKLSDFLSSRKNPTRQTNAKKVVLEDVRTPSKVKQTEEKTIELIEMPSVLDSPPPSDDKVVPEKRETESESVSEPKVVKQSDKSGAKMMGIKSEDSKEQLVAEPLTRPAYERFEELITPTSCRLHLPPKYALLLRIHHAIDSLCQLSAARDQPAIFHRIQKAAQNIVGRDVTMEHVKQINHLFPEAYDFRKTTIVHEGRRTQSFVVSMKPMANLTHSQLVARRQLLHESLLSLVHAAHLNFLKEIGVKVPLNAKFKSWHPKFCLESVPEVSSKELFEEEPVNKKNQPNVPVQIQEVIEQVERESQKSSPTKKQACSISKPAEEPPTPKNKLSLLERIKAKEKENEISSIIVNANVDESRKAAERARLCELAENLLFLFTSAGKSSLLVGDITGKLAMGCKVSTSETDILDRLKLLATKVPEWLQLVLSGSTLLAKLNKKMTLREVKELLAKAD